MAKYHHTESKLQIQCVTWFAYEFPYLRQLLYHPKNEGGHGRTQGAISKAEGVVAGVADLMLQLSDTLGHSCLAIEMKSPTGRQSKEQKLFQLYLQAAHGKYVVVRSFEDFKAVVLDYVASADPAVTQALKALYKGQRQAEVDQARDKLRKLAATKGYQEGSIVNETK